MKKVLRDCANSPKAKASFHFIKFSKIVSINREEIKVICFEHEIKKGAQMVINRIKHKQYVHVPFRKGVRSNNGY